MLLGAGAVSGETSLAPKNYKAFGANYVLKLQVSVTFLANSHVKSLLNLDGSAAVCVYIHFKPLVGV